MEQPKIKKYDVKLTARKVDYVYQWKTVEAENEEEAKQKAISEAYEDVKAGQYWWEYEDGEDPEDITVDHINCSE